jgi:secretion/DNA translocation related TadE-like protein
MSNHHSYAPRDRGSATVWAAAGVSVIMIALLVGLHLGAAVIARHQAEAAADLAALAAAGVAVEGAPAACGRAVEVAAAMGGRVTSCRLAGWDALVAVRVPIPVALPGIDGAEGRARAGPVTSADPSQPAPPVVDAAPPSERPATHSADRPPAAPPPGRTTSGRSTRTGGPTCGGARRPRRREARPTTRRTTGTLVVTPVPIGDDLWRRRGLARLLDVVPAGAARREPLVAPQIAVGSERRNRRPSRYPAQPRPDRRRPARPRQGRPATVYPAPLPTDRPDSRPSASSTTPSTRTAPDLSSGALPLPHFGDCTQEGQPPRHSQSPMAERVAVSQRPSTA